MKNNKVKILFLDIETAPLLSSCWGIWEQNIPLNQIERDWSIISWSAKWKGSKKIFYQDNRNSKNIEDDKNLLQGIWKLMDEADVIIGQNSKKFDIKKLNARFILNGMKPPSPFRQIDTMQLAKKHFAFTSNKLEYLSKNLSSDYKKSNHKKYPGFELWKECIKGNKEAWIEMEKYNKMDVLSLEAVYDKLAPWDSTINFSTYSDSLEIVCNCGSTKFEMKGYAYTATGRFQRFKCKKCGKNHQGRQNLLSKEKRKSLLK